ncbi:pyridoxamine 5'-phosphate oxidase [Allocatelliglobosispora scoriae]|uniref:Pyridoxine/pyridoxamine 5'-phosphate oxidase n=1 Tax=Allocatelliglobosispora scoriae TaxID=643052 RepID=A0A841BP65_9ACTN|nr:pyridoxamine 5'-phosphate oxidase [Allocatelliglobosispora scoriae]MBB5868743.1 pyridoxamine 5'-phosphate oxidase [Allocatelliglobosispora scoriae]
MTPEAEPFALFGEWLAAAGTTEVNDPNAMAVATVDADGLPNVRMVLLKDFDIDGFVFYTNTRSAKGGELADNMRAAGVLHWKSVRRQVRFRGPVEGVTDAEADAYFASRARDSRIGAWASQQSRPLADRAELEAAVARETARFGSGEVPRPVHWTGFRIRPVYLEFWTDMPFRLHDRLVYRRDKPEGDWSRGLLHP